MLSSRPALSRLVVQTVRRYHQGEYKRPTMDELPIPQGSWQANYDAKQRRNNATLAFGIAFLVGSITMARYSGLIHLNFFPPSSPD